MIDVALAAGVPLACALLGALCISTRAWPARRVPARQYSPIPVRARRR
ncbi:MAG: hypothetical protein IT338_19590 [Thermomicrobiales bacterium]|nr:hypothetical protein [Thermomicrobiales bacterium]